MNKERIMADVYKDFFGEDLYKEVCWIQNISDGSFIK